MSPNIATNTTVDLAGLIEFVNGRRHWVLSTIRQDGRPQMSPVTGAVLADGRLAVATYPMRDKVVNIRRNGLVSVCVQSDEFGGSWVQVDGTATVVDLPEAVEGLVEYYRAASGEHPDWDEYREAMVRQGKCLIAIEIERWGPVAKGGFPPMKKMFENWEDSGEPAEDSGPQMFDD